MKKKKKSKIVITTTGNIENMIKQAVEVEKKRILDKICNYLNEHKTDENVMCYYTDTQQNEISDEFIQKLLNCI